MDENQGACWFQEAFYASSRFELSLTIGEVLKKVNVFRKRNQSRFFFCHQEYKVLTHSFSLIFFSKFSKTVSILIRILKRKRHYS